MSAEWRGDDHGSLAILKGGQEMITWKIQESVVVCVRGSDLLTYDPHELWQRTGSALPKSEDAK